MRLFLQFTLLCLSLLPPWAAAQNWNSDNSPFVSESRDFLPVTEAYQPVLSLQPDNRLAINWQIADAYYLYREQFAAEIFVDGARSRQPQDFGEAIIKDDPYFGETPVYYNFANTEWADIPRQTFLVRLTAQGCADAGLCYPPHDWLFRVDPGRDRITEISRATWDAAAGTNAPSASIPALGLMLLFALLGGVILNLMPCVFPVLGLKVLSFSQSRQGTAVLHGAIYSIGVVASFLVVALLLIALQSAGAAIGWGFQLQTPWFVALLSCVFFILSLNLLGVFEIRLLTGAPGQNLSQRQDYVGSFFTGVLATVVATPCTAPFMGTALGFAATQPATTSLAVFGALGAGMALPVFVLTLFPGALRRLPRSGPWMEHLKQLLSFPLLATAIWLCWVIGRQTGADGMAITLLAWLLIGLGIWLIGLGGRVFRSLGVAALLGTLLLMTATPLTEPGKRQITGREDTVVYSPAKLAALRAKGQPVFLDVTADWCITCKVNEQIALNTDRVQAAFAEREVVYMVADWTLYDARITALLEAYQRNGIPLYLMFVPGEERARVLPQILTENGVLRALEAIE